MCVCVCVCLAYRKIRAHTPFTALDHGYFCMLYRTVGMGEKIKKKKKIIIIIIIQKISTARSQLISLAGLV